MNILRELHKAQGWHYRCSDAPDTTAMNAAAASQAAMSREQLDWAKQIYGESAPERAAAAARAAQVSDAQLRAMNSQTNLADEYAAYNRETFRPLEKSIVADAAAYDTPERRNEAAVQAAAGVEMSLANQRGSTMRDQERSGVNPNSGKALAIQGAMDLGGAKLKAGASSAARTQVETVGQARKMDAVNLGRGLPSSQATAAGLAVNQGNSSVSNLASTGNITGQGAALMNSGFSGAQSGMAGAANTYGSIANIQGRAQDDGVLGGLGQLATGAGAMGMKFSDKNIKNSRKKITGKASLAQIKRLPSNESWRYNKGSIGDDGGKTHQGHMAQDVNRVMGEQAAPAGRMINTEHMAAAGLSAIKELSKKLDKTHRQVMSLANVRKGARS